MSLDRPNEIYSYVDYLVGRFTRSREERLTFSLDNQLNHDSKTTFREIIGTQYQNLTGIQSPSDVPHDASINEMIEIMRGKLNDLDFGILVQLLHNGTNPSNTSPEDLTLTKDDVISRLPQIQERVETLARTYERDGRLVIPRRPIVYVQFDPVFYIKFGRRNYDGDPLTLFNADRNVYEGMSRSEFAKFDPGFAQALREANQMSLAIPQTNYSGSNNYLKPHQVKRVVDSWKATGGILKEAVKLTGHGGGTIQRIWNENGLRAMGWYIKE